MEFPGGTQDATADRPRRPRRVLLWSLLAAALVLVALVAAALWLGGRALAVKDRLERAESLVAELQDSVGADPAAAPAIADRLIAETGAAREDADGLLWRAGESFPLLGANLSVVRRLTAVVDDVARDAVHPLASAGGSLESLAPKEGAVDLAAVGLLVDSIRGADAALQRAVDEVDSIDATGTVGQVSEARDRLAALLGTAAEAAGPAAEVAPLVVPMLGGEGPRNYLLLFQNPAESVPLGGNPAAMLLMTVDQGRVEIARQASSRDFRAYIGSPIPLPADATSAYNPDYPQTVMDIGGRPHFPTMAELAKGYWERDIGGSVDGVVSFDPVALASLLQATGPVPLASGDTLTSENAVPLLLYEVYARYPRPADQDVFFAAAAAAIFDRLTDGDADPRELLTALSAAADSNRLMVWSGRQEEQQLLETTPLAGILPADNRETTTVGVYFDDTSVSKLSYFVDTAVTATETCSEVGERTFAVTYTLSSRLTAAQAATLPDYVASHWLPTGHIGTDIYVLGPPGSTFLDWTVDSPGVGDELRSVGADGPRPVVRATTYLGPEGSATATARFSAPAGDYGPVAVRTTPMVNPTSVTVASGSCG